MASAPSTTRTLGRVGRLAVAATAALTSIGLGTHSVGANERDSFVHGGDGATAAAITDYATVCPEITDSVYRLYTAYFLREPDDAGWEYWMNTYGTTLNSNLDVVSEAFASSQEFQNTYGSLSNEDFVTLVYRNVTEREPDAAGFNHWVASLNSGYPRGSVMAAFSESREYVNKTGSVNPLAGFLMWYDRGMRFHCGIGGKASLLPQDMSSPYVDMLVYNVGDQPVDINVEFRGDLGTEVVETSTLDPGFYYLLYNTEYFPQDNEVIALDILSGNPNDIFYTIVSYDNPHSPDRPDWAFDDQ